MAELTGVQTRGRADAQVERRGVIPTDRLFLAYLLVSTAIVLARSGRIPSWPLLLALNALAALLVALLPGAPRSRLTDFVGGAYPILAAPAFYGLLGVMTTDAGFVHDRVIQRWEQALFGGQVSVTWHQRMSGAGLSWVLHVCYLSYYLILFGTPVYLFLRRSRDAFERCGFIVTLGLYACYLVFALFPVAGPRYFWGNATGPATEVLPARLVRTLLEGGSAWGTAFPSSHVTAAWCAVYALWRAARATALLLAPVALGLALGTVFGQLHYGLDALAGAATALLLCGLADPLRRVLASASRPSS